MRVIAVMGSLAAMVWASGCATPAHYQGRESEYRSTVNGALVGGTLGGIIGNNVGDRKNDVLGAAVGALAGAWVGQQYGAGQDQTRHRIEALESMNSQETLMIQNSNGSYTPVQLAKVGYGQYRGPRGEIYTSRPSEQQLRTAYGF